MLFYIFDYTIVISEKNNFYPFNRFSILSNNKDSNSGPRHWIILYMNVFLLEFLLICIKLQSISVNQLHYK